MTSPASPDPLVRGVDSVLITAELATRPSNTPDYQSESRALGLLAQEMATNPRGVLQKCAELVMELCHADSAGISILEPGGTGGVLRWHAAAGGFASHLHTTMPQEASPCGTVIERDCVLLFHEAERFFPAVRDVEPRIYENLLAPWHVHGEAVGTVWAIKHTPEGRFDAEDARVLQSLARFAAAAFQMTSALDEATAERAELEQRTNDLHETEARLQAAIDLVGLSPYSWDPATGAVDWDARLKAMWGLPPDAHVDKTVFLSAVHPEDRPRVEAAIAACIDPAGSGLYAIEYRVIGIQDGIERWVFSRGRTTFENGQPAGFIGAVLDITARKRVEEALRESEGRARLLLAELQHRVRNILAMVRSVATRSVTEYMTANDHAEHLAGRLDAMARTQALLARRPGEGIEIEDLIRDELVAQAAAEDRLRIAGPGVLLSPKAAEVLTLAVHELATNSIKYGALGADGELSITWDVEGRGAEKSVTLVWEESGVEISASASPRGFGTELITKRVPYELDGSGAIEFGTRGMRATITFPLRSAGSILETGPTGQEEQA